MIQAESVPADLVAVAKCDLAGEVLRSFGSLHFRATGWSMLPTMRPGDTLVVERVNAGQVDTGEVVLVGRGGRLCAHRVVSKAEDSGNRHWVTQGDAMPAPDRPVSEQELLGRVAYLIRAGKLMAVPAELSVVDRWIARILRRSFLAARALVYFHSRLQAPEESVLPCQG